MHSFLRKFITQWRRLDLPTSEQTVVAAVSGGADSVSLLLALHRLREMQKLDLRIVAAHFNHGLRGAESDLDEEFVRQLTSKLSIELAVGRSGPLGDGNLEEKARTARYQYLGKTAGALSAFALTTGHTVNDQAETFLMNLVRGSGPQGLCGMRPIRPLDELPPKQSDACEPAPASDAPALFNSSTLLVRPLLSWAKRSDTEGFCHDMETEYRYDTMNEDTAFKRVRIRKVLIPLLEDLNPRIIETLAQTADLMQGLRAGSNGGADPSEQPIELRINDLKSLDRHRQLEYIRAWLGARRGSFRQLEMKHIQAVVSLALSTKSGRSAEIPGGGRVIRSDGRLLFEENKVENWGIAN